MNFGRTNLENVDFISSLGVYCIVLHSTIKKADANVGGVIAVIQLVRVYYIVLIRQQ